MKTFNLKVTLTNEELNTIVEAIASRHEGPVRDKDLREVLNGCFDAGLEDYLSNVDFKNRISSKVDQK